MNDCSFKGNFIDVQVNLKLGAGDLRASPHSASATTNSPGWLGGRAEEIGVRDLDASGAIGKFIAVATSSSCTTILRLIVSCRLSSSLVSLVRRKSSSFIYTFPFVSIQNDNGNASGQCCLSKEPRWFRQHHPADREEAPQTRLSIQCHLRWCVYSALLSLQTFTDNVVKVKPVWANPR